MKTTKYLFYLTALLATGLSSCVKSELFNTPHPDKGQITLTTEWTNRSAGISLPASYTVTVDGQTLNYTQFTNILPLLNPGSYTINTYNTTDNIYISGTTATVQTSGTTVSNNPGWLFTSSLDAVTVADRDDEYTVSMQQQVRQLTIDLTVTEGDPARIASTRASLSGIANTIDYKSNTHSGTGLSVVPVFTRAGSRLTAVVRLLGTTSEAQELTLDITFTDGRTQQVVSDISSLMAGFNGDKTKPLTVTGNLLTPIETGFTATINGWIVVNGGNVVAW